VAQARRDGQRELRGRQGRRHGERVAHRLRLARTDGQRRDLAAELRDLVLVEHAAILVDDERAEHVRVLIRRVARVREPRRGEPAPTTIRDLDLDPRVLRIENAAREPVADEQVADHHVELELRAGDHRCAIGRQVPRARRARCDHACTGDVDRRGALELRLREPELLAIAPHRRHPGVPADEPVRSDRALLRAELLRRGRGALHVALDAVLLLDLVHAREPVARERGAPPLPGLVNADEVHGQVHVGREEPAVARGAQPGIELRGDLLLVACDRSRVAELGCIDRRRVEHEARVAVGRGRLDAVAQPARHAGVRAQILGGNRRVARHHAVGEQREIVTAAAVLARRLAHIAAQ
jgi:hypothetical protein